MSKAFIVIIMSSILGCKSLNISIRNPESFYPVHVGNTWKYQYVNSISTLKVSIVDENILINGNSYFKIDRNYSWGEKSIDYIRNLEGTIYQFDYKTNAESISIPEDLTIGSTWNHADGSWKYEIINLDANVETPKNRFTELLQIRATQLTGRDKRKLQVYDLFFKKGMGLVAANGDDQLMYYLINLKLN